MNEKIVTILLLIALCFLILFNSIIISSLLRSIFYSTKLIYRNIKNRRYKTAYIQFKNLYVSATVSILLVVMSICAITKYINK